MKKLIFFIFCLTIITSTDLYSMEKFIEKSEDEPVEIVALTALLPDELLVHIVELATHSNAPIEFNEDKTSCFQFGPQKILNTNSNKVTLYSGNQWVPSTNLNTAQIGYVNENTQNQYLFTVQCWHKNDIIFGNRYYETDYRIDDDAQEKRFMASTSLETTKPFFDGPSEDGIFVIAGNSKHKVNVTQEEDLADIAEEMPEKKSAGLLSWLGFGKKEQPVLPVLPSQQKVYEYYIGKFNSQSTRLHKKDIYTNKDWNEFNFISPKIIGTLSALALCKTRNWNPEYPTDNKNRYALADDEGISVYEIKEQDEKSTSSAKKNKKQKNHEDKLSVQQIGSGLIKEKKKVKGQKNTYKEIETELKKLSFITPKTLLGLTKSGKLFSFALDTQFNAITSAPHTIKNKKGKKINVHTFAVNPCNPSQLVLCTTAGNILYLNLKHSMKPTQEKKAKFLMNVKKLPDSMWFYDTRLCLGNYSAIETENYTLADLDLRLEKD